jgi:hypothetical protein
MLAYVPSRLLTRGPIAPGPAPVAFPAVAALAVALAALAGTGTPTAEPLALASPEVAGAAHDPTPPATNVTLEILAEPIASPEPEARSPRSDAAMDVAPDPSRLDTWEAVAGCESGYGGEARWDLDTGNGYYGGLQFSLDSWRWVGGRGYPHEASKTEQIRRAELLLERQGWAAWPACSRKLGLR